MKLLFSLVILLLSLSAQAVDFALILGYRNNGLTGDVGSASYKNTNKYQFGALAFIPIFVDNVKMRTGFIYAVRDMTGNTGYNDINGNPIDFQDRMSYVDIPIDLQINTPLDLYFYGGFKYGIKLNSSCVVGDPSIACNAGWQPNDIVENIGLGYELFKSAVSLALEVEYENGLSDVNNTPGLGSQRTNSWNANLILKF